MASVIVLDASVLVYGLGQVRRWCRDERKEILIVPLEGDKLSPYLLAVDNLFLTSIISLVPS